MSGLQWGCLVGLAAIVGFIGGYVAGQRMMIQNTLRWLTRAELVMRDAARAGNTTAIVELPGFVEARRTFKLMFAPRAD